MSFPVLSMGDIWALTGIFGNSISTPSEALLGPGMEIISVGSVSDAQIQAALPG